jgi:hypothetical protein
VQPVPSSVVGKKAKKKVLHKTHGERVVLTGMSVT